MDEKIEQLLKGVTAAMYANAEELQKSNDEREAQRAEVALIKAQQEMELEKVQNEQQTQELVKQIKEGVLAELQKANSIYGEKENMDLNGDKEKSVSHKDVFYSEGGDEDSQVDAKDHNETDEVQQTLHAGGTKSLQLMIKKAIRETLGPDFQKHFLKEHEAQYAGGDDSGVAEEVMEEPVEQDMGMDMGDEGDGSAEYPMEEEEFDMDSEKMYKSLQKQLQTAMESIPDMVMKKAQELSEAQLLKSGFRKEQSRQPQITKQAMGLDASDYAIQKSQDSGKDFDITKVSFGDLYTAKMQRDTGSGTEGLPEDFFKG